MEWTEYAGILRRRWLLIAAILILDIIVSGYSFARSYRHAGYQSCLTLYVADVSSPSLLSAPSSLLDTAGQLLAGETAANFFADDILDVSRSQRVATYIAQRLAPRNLPNTSLSSVNGSISGSRLDRTVGLCAANPAATSAQAVGTALAAAMTSQRARFIGAQMAHRTYVTVVSNPSTAPVSAGHGLTTFALKLFLGLLLALGLALLWEALDPSVRNRQDIVSALGIPVVEARV